MRRDPRSFLWDVRDAVDAISTFAGGRAFADYVADRMPRSAVERQFEIIGEALNQLVKVDPELARQIPALRRIVGFRNVLIHGYHRIDDPVVWRTIDIELPPLRAQVAPLLAEKGDYPE